MMARAFSKLVDYIRGGGDYSISVPPFDGALRPNERIEQGRILASVPAPDNLVATPDGVVFSSGHSLLACRQVAAGFNVATLEQYPTAVTALAAFGDTLAVGLDSGGVTLRGGIHDGRTFAAFDEQRLNCPVALAFEESGSLLVANGSARHGASRWKHDLLERGASGSVWRVALASGHATRLAHQLAFPYGLLPLSDGSLLVAESWRHRIIRLGRDGRLDPVLQDLAAYPARLTRCASGGTWVAMFAPRRRLVEFVLREPAYRERMMTEIPSDCWIAPSLAPMTSFLEPLQGGTLKVLARLKPWAPSRSYGLIVRLDANHRPVESLHSRGDGTRHGIRSVLETNTGLLAASAGANALVLMERTNGR